MNDSQAEKDVYDGTKVLHSIEEMKSFFEVQTDDDLADFVGNAGGIETDVSIDYAGETRILVFGFRLGTGLEFPMTLDAFWAQVSETEAQHEEWLAEDFA